MWRKVRRSEWSVCGCLGAGWGSRSGHMALTSATASSCLVDLQRTECSWVNTVFLQSFRGSLNLSLTVRQLLTPRKNTFGNVTAVEKMINTFLFCFFVVVFSPWFLASMKFKTQNVMSKIRTEEEDVEQFSTKIINVCVYMYVYMCVVCMHSIYVYIFICVYLCLHVYMSKCMCVVCMYIQCMSVYVHIYLYMCRYSMYV